MQLPDELVGAWISDPTDLEGISEFGNVSLEFQPDGSLTYTIHAESTDQKMFLLCRVERGLLISTQPSARLRRNKRRIRLKRMADSPCGFTAGELSTSDPISERRAFLPAALQKIVDAAELTSHTRHGVRVSAEVVEEFRSAFTDRLAKVGFGDSSELTTEPRVLEDLLEDLIDRLNRQSSIDNQKRIENRRSTNQQ